MSYDSDFLFHLIKSKEEADKIKKLFNDNNGVLANNYGTKFILLKNVESFIIDSL